jgi:hypothetical protein
LLRPNAAAEPDTSYYDRDTSVRDSGPVLDKAAAAEGGEHQLFGRSLESSVRRRSQMRYKLSMGAIATRRQWLIGSLAVALGGCHKLHALLSDGPDPDEPQLTEDELVRSAVAPAAGTFTGKLEARSFMSYGGCADQGTLLRWLVIAIDGKRMPLRLVDAGALARLRAGDEAALERDSEQAELLTPDDADRLGLSIGSRATLEGVHAALHFSGTMALTPVYGLCTDHIRPA